MKQMLYDNPADWLLTGPKYRSYFPTHQFQDYVTTFTGEELHAQWTIALSLDFEMWNSSVEHVRFCDIHQTWDSILIQNNALSRWDQSYQSYFTTQKYRNDTSSNGELLHAQRTMVPSLGFQMWNSSVKPPSEILWYSSNLRLNFETVEWSLKVGMPSKWVVLI